LNGGKADTESGATALSDVSPREVPRVARRDDARDHSPMPSTLTDVATRDGHCPTHLFRPASSAPWPVVLVFMDAIGIRPAMLAVGERLADEGYFAMIPDLYYRGGAYAPMNAKTVLVDPDEKKTLFEHFIPLASPANVLSDAAALLAFAAAQPDVRVGGIATVGYCMGGALSLLAAGTYPDRVSAAASYHGSRLASDAPGSPHLLAPQMTARIYVAGAIDDASFPDAMKERLEHALTDAGVEHLIETYQARHGFALTDTLAFDAKAEARHWTALLALLRTTFGT
jgi:carboxymethylenebutenolidase